MGKKSIFLVALLSTLAIQSAASSNESSIFFRHKEIKSRCRLPPHNCHDPNVVKEYERIKSIRRNNQAYCFIQGFNQYIVEHGMFTNIACEKLTTRVSELGLESISESDYTKGYIKPNGTTKFHLLCKNAKGVFHLKKYQQLKQLLDLKSTNLFVGCTYSIK